MKKASLKTKLWVCMLKFIKVILTPHLFTLLYSLALLSEHHNLLNFIHEKVKSYISNGKYGIRWCYKNPFFTLTW